MTKYTEAPPAIKWVVIIIHFIFLIFGIILIAVGAWVEIHAGPHSDISAFNVLAGNRVLMFTGCVLALISLAGIVAAIINSKVFLIIVFVLLVITLSFEIAGIIVAWDNQAKINRSILADLKNRIKNFPGPGTRVVDSIQERLQCCGADSGPNDWMNNKHFLQSASVPDSCCKQEYREKDCGLGQIIANTRIHTEPCASKYKNMLDDKVDAIAGFGLAVLILQVLTMPLTLLMFCKIKEIE